MRLLIIYQPESDHARSVDEFVHEFTRLHPDFDIQLMDADNAEAQNLEVAYDIVQYPATLVLANDGTVHNMWTGHSFPLMDDVLGYLNA